MSAWTDDPLGRVLAALEAAGCEPRPSTDGTTWTAVCPCCGERDLVIEPPPEGAP